MEYTYPAYFYDFQCVASECTDTCCAAWEIMIDPVSLKKYRKYPGFFGNRLKNSIDWERKSFEQYAGRCSFLNEENLCDIYTEAGKKMLCKTCTRYPRHYEEYENLREISLSLSCPAAARMILGSSEPVTFLSSCRETPEEEYESFDFFLFTKLQEIRDYLYEVIQNSELPVEDRAALILAVTHDLEKRIRKGRLYEIDDMLNRCQTPVFQKKAAEKWRLFRGQESKAKHEMHALFRRMYRLEVLDPKWTAFLKKAEHQLYEELSAETYGQVCSKFREFMKEREYEYEQLLMYFVFTYFCGAVYDENAFAKVKFAVYCTWMIRELDMARWLEKGRTFTLDDQIEIAHRLSREIEHSDPNLEALEQMMLEESVFSLQELLSGILGTTRQPEKKMTKETEEAEV